VCDQNRTGWLEDGAVEQNLRFGLGIGLVAEVVEVAVGAEAADDVGAGRGVKAHALGSDGDCAVVADADAGALAPDKGPPRTGRYGAQDRAALGQRLGACGVRGGAQFAMGFVLVGVGQELVQELVGGIEVAD